MWHALAISPRNRTIQIHLYTIRIKYEVQPNNQAIYIHPQTHVYALELERFNRPQDIITAQSATVA